jgi:para-nitrobenzyl esterase
MICVKKHELSNYALTLILLLVSMSGLAENGTLRHPAVGPISGAVDENGALAWLGVPYAQAPIGKLRWKAPRALTPFDQVFAATSLAEMCTQLGNPLLDIESSLYGKAVGSEDCLYLNIWSPSESRQGREGEKKLPVMVWIHGGSNVGGSSRIYYPGNLVVQQNVVVVSINYRLGLFGWFSHPSLRAAADSTLDKSSNFGMLDIIQALHWVGQNIEAFGGDPANITLFGESAGAMNAVALLYSPLARGLFHKVIAQSGSLRQTPLEVAEQFTADDRSEFSSSETAAKILVQRKQAGNREEARELVAGMGDEQFLKLMYSATGEELIGTYEPDIGLRIRVPQIIPDNIVIPASSPWELIAELTSQRSRICPF